MKDEVVRTIMFIHAVADEVTRARQKFPNNKHMLAALVEEVGEVANALLERDYCEGEPTNASEHLTHDRHVWKECVQAAAMCVRVATEGDPSFQYIPRKL